VPVEERHFVDLLRAGGAIRLVKNQKKRCLSPRKFHREKAYAAGRAVIVTKVTFINAIEMELMYPLRQNSEDRISW
jgi:hypothetical protein